jgi:hypothetical protein
VRSSSVTFAFYNNLLNASIKRATALPRLLQGLSLSLPTLLPALLPATPQRSPPLLSIKDALEDDFELLEQGLSYYFNNLNNSTIINNLMPLRCPKAPRYLDISASFSERNILNLSIKRSRKLTASKITSLAAAIALPNYTLPICIACAFALAMLSNLVINKLLPKLNGLKQARLYKYLIE